MHLLINGGVDFKTPPKQPCLGLVLRDMCSNTLECRLENPPEAGCHVQAERTEAKGMSQASG